MADYGIVYKGKFRHKKDCMSNIVNPITQWGGGANVAIIGYKCPECGIETFNEGESV